MYIQFKTKTNPGLNGTSMELLPVNIRTKYNLIIRPQIIIKQNILNINKTKILVDHFHDINS